MKIDFSTPLLDFSGEPLPDDKGEPATLATLAVGALLATINEGQGRAEMISPSEKCRFAKLAQDVFDGGEVDLKVEDAALIKERIGRVFPQIYVMRAWELLDA